MNKKTTEQFIKEAKEIHNNKYDYSLVEYRNSKTKVKIICLIHGEFLQTPNHHLRNSGCPICAGRLNNKDFIKKAKDIHGDKYDYSLIEYKDYKTKIKIICPIHGEFLQSPKFHLKGSICPKCSGKYRINIQEFIKEAKKIHGNKYDYSLIEYKNTRTKVKIICPIHGEFFQSPSNHLKGYGCLKCSGTKKYNTNEFIQEAKKIHGNKYDYSLVEYKDALTKVKIICPIHGEFEQRAASHLTGRGCPVCNESKGERRIRILLQENNIKFEYQKRFENFNKYPFDFYLPEYNLLIEFDGEQHFETVWEDVEIIQERDTLKDKYAFDNDYYLIRIRYWEIEEIDDILNKLWS